MQSHTKKYLTNIIINYDIAVFMRENKLILLQPQIHLTQLRNISLLFAEKTLHTYFARFPYLFII